MAGDFTYEEILNKDILELLGAQDLPLETKQEIYSKIFQTIQNRTIARIFDQLSEKDADKLRQLIDAGEKSEIESFLKNKDIDVAKMLLEEAIIFKSEIASLRSKNA